MCDISKRLYYLFDEASGFEYGGTNQEPVSLDFARLMIKNGYYAADLEGNYINIEDESNE